MDEDCEKECGTHTLLIRQKKVNVEEEESGRNVYESGEGPKWRKCV